jgi:hypothetical protein
MNVLRSCTLPRLIIAAVFGLCAHATNAADRRLDVATYNNSGDDTDWFGDSQVPYLSFPSANGHDIEQGSNVHISKLTPAGNSLGMYYDPFHTLYSPTETPAAAASTIESWCNSNFGSGNTSRWLVLNEVDASTWNGSSGDAYRTWLVNTVSTLNSAGYKNIVLYSPRYLASKTYASTWQSIANNAYIGVESYLDGQTVKNDNFSLSKVQAYYQGYYDSWTSASSGAGLAPSRVFAGEHFSVNLYDPTHYWGANGISGTDWQAAIEIRDIAIHNIPFGGFIGYAWDKNAQATGNASTDLAAQISYEKAYASTLVVQSELPAWTGNDGSTSWADYLNWTGGLPSIASAPFPLLASTNPNLPKQTAANFLNAIKSNTAITLDGNQSITKLSFGSAFSYTIAPGTGGSLTVAGSGASISVTSGSHTISAGAVIGSNVAASLTGNLTLSGSVTNNGFTLSKSGNGTLNISGSQSNAANSAIAISAGTVTFNTDAGSAAASHLALSQSGGTTVFNTPQHLSSLSMTGGSITVNAGDLTQIATTLSSTGGQIVSHTGGISVDNNSTAAVSLTGRAPAIVLDFDTPGNMSAGPYWALSWQGDHVAALTGYLNQSGFTGNGEILVATNQTYFNLNDLTVGTTSVNGVQYTFVGFDALAGDFNNDGRIDAADYVVWRKGLGTTYTQNDYDLWRAHFGPLAGSGSGAIANAAVPEPTTLALLMFAAIGLCLRKFWRNGKYQQLFNA